MRLLEQAALGLRSGCDAVTVQYSDSDGIPCVCRKELQQSRTKLATAESQLTAAQAKGAGLEADVRRVTSLAVAADTTVQEYVTALKASPAGP